MSTDYLIDVFIKGLSATEFENNVNLDIFDMYVNLRVSTRRDYVIRHLFKVSFHIM